MPTSSALPAPILPLSQFGDESLWADQPQPDGSTKTVKVSPKQIWQMTLLGTITSLQNLTISQDGNTLITTSVVSVAGKNGAVTLNHADILDWNTAAPAAAPVQQVAGRTGSIALNHTDIGDWSVATSLYGLWNAGSVVAVGTNLALNPQGTLTAAGSSSQHFLGGYNAITNTPSLGAGGTGSGGGVNGNTWVVTNAGSVAVDGLGALNVSDQIVNNGSLWVRLPMSAVYGSMAAQNANSVAINGGSIVGQTTLGLSTGDVLMAAPIAMPDFSQILASDGANISVAVDSAGTLWVQALNLRSELPTLGVVSSYYRFTTGDSVTALAGILSQPDLSQILASDGTNVALAVDSAGTTIAQALQVQGTIYAAGVQTSGSPQPFLSSAYALTNGDTLMVLAGSLVQPDLGHILSADTHGNIALGVDVNGTTVAQALDAAGTVTAQAFVTKGGGTSGRIVPNDALDVTAYGMVGDLQRDVLLASFVNGGTVVTLGKYSGGVTVVGGSTLQLSGIAMDQGRVFEPFDIGANVFVQSTDGSGVSTTLPITGFVYATNAAILGGTIANTMTAANVVWPVPGTADVGKAIRIDGGQAQILRPAYDSGQQPWMGTIAAVNGNTITVGGTIAGFNTLSVANPGLPTDVSWGTDNTNSLYNAGLDLIPTGKRRLYFPKNPATGRTGYGAFRMSWRFVAADNSTDPYFFLWTVDSSAAVNLSTWVGDPNVHGMMADVSGRLLMKAIVPSGAPPPPTPRCDLDARMHLPRLCAIAQGGTVQVMETGDSLSRYNPTGQSFAWFDVNVFERKLRDGNPHRSFAFSSVGANGLGWSETVAPPNIVQWALPGTDVFWLGSSGYNDSNKTNTVQKIMKAICTVRALPEDTHGNRPDMMFTTCISKPENMVGAGIWDQWARHTAPSLNRGIARWLGYGWTDLTEFGDLALLGVSEQRRALMLVPEPAPIALSAASPLLINRRCNAFSFGVISFASSSGAALWTAMGRLYLPVSPQPGNGLWLDNDPATNLMRLKYDIWGQQFNGVTISTSGSLLSAGAPVVSTGTLSWPTGTGILSMANAPFAGSQGQCLLLPGCDTYNQPLRTVIDNVINAGTVAVQDLNCVAFAGGSTNYVANTTISLGSVSFIPDDADSQTNIGITNAGGTVLYYGTIVALSNSSTVTVTPTPPALSNVACNVWLGHSVTGWTVMPAWQAASGAATQMISFALKDDQLSVGRGKAAPTFRISIPRWGDDYYPGFLVTGPGTVTATISGIYMDQSIPFMPVGTYWETFQDAAGHNSPYGGDGGHYGSRVPELIHKPVFDAANFRGSP